jgi:hypothetical protein
MRLGILMRNFFYDLRAVLDNIMMKQIHQKLIPFELHQQLKEQHLKLQRHCHLDLNGLSDALDDDVQQFLLGDQFLLTQSVENVAEQVN